MTSQCPHSPSYGEPLSFVHCCPIVSPQSIECPARRHGVVDQWRSNDAEIADLCSSTDPSSCLDDLIQRTCSLTRQMEQKMAQKTEFLLCQEKSAMGDNACQSSYDLDRDVLADIPLRNTDYYRGLTKDKWFRRRTLLEKTEFDMNGSFSKILAFLRQMEQGDEFSNIRTELHNLRAQVKLLSMASERLGASNCECKFISDLEKVTQCIECVYRQYDRAVCELTRIRSPREMKSRKQPLDRICSNIAQSPNVELSSCRRPNVCEYPDDETNVIGVCPLKEPCHRPSTPPRTSTPCPATDPPRFSPPVCPAVTQTSQDYLHHSCSYHYGSCPHICSTPPFIPICIPCPSLKGTSVCYQPCPTDDKDQATASQPYDPKGSGNALDTYADLKKDPEDLKAQRTSGSPQYGALDDKYYPSLHEGTQTEQYGPATFSAVGTPPVMAQAPTPLPGTQMAHPQLYHNFGETLSVETQYPQTDTQAKVCTCKDSVCVCKDEVDEEDNRRFHIGLKLFLIAMAVILFCQFYSWLKRGDKSTCPDCCPLCEADDSGCFPWCSFDFSSF